MLITFSAAFSVSGIKEGVGVKSVNINAESFVFIPFSRV